MRTLAPTLVATPTLVAALCLTACSASTSATPSTAPASTAPSTMAPATASATAVAPASTVTSTPSATSAPSSATVAASSSSTPTSSGPSASPAPSGGVRRGARPRQIKAIIRSEDQIEAKLSSTSASFRSTVRQEFRAKAANCPENDNTIIVDWYWPDDQVIGNVGGCGEGALRLWFRPRGGGWNHYDTQDVPYCRTLHEIGVPERMDETHGLVCLDAGAQKPHDYEPTS